MLILSQDKKNVINFDKVSNIWVEQTRVKYQCPDIEDFWGTLGEYENEERAEQVLIEIIERYDTLKRRSVYSMGDGGYTFEDKFYYKMPKK
ncbi:MAG: hypothetical protein IKM97_04880 [Clostridia bacterium]|nr:hypothetical protein [Clostridia bacterium]